MFDVPALEQRMEVSAGELPLLSEKRNHRKPHGHHHHNHRHRGHKGHHRQKKRQDEVVESFQTSCGKHEGVKKEKNMLRRSSVVRDVNQVSELSRATGVAAAQGAGDGPAERKSNHVKKLRDLQHALPVTEASVHPKRKIPKDKTVAVTRARKKRSKVTRARKGRG